MIKIFAIYTEFCRQIGADRGLFIARISKELDKPKKKPTNHTVLKGQVLIANKHKKVKSHWLPVKLKLK